MLFCIEVVCSFLFAIAFSIVLKYHHLFLYSTVDGHLNCF